MKLLALFNTFLLLVCHVADSRAASFFQKLEKVQHSRAKNKDGKMMMYLVKSKYYFSAISFAQAHLEKTKKQTSVDFDEYFDRLVIQVGIDPFLSFKARHLNKTQAPSAAYIVAKKAMQKKRYSLAVKFLNRIPEGHRFYPEALLASGVALNQLGDMTASIDKYLGCSKTADTLGGNISATKTKKFYRLIQELCIMNMARSHYKNGNFERAKKYYEKIPKTSYIWPYVLKEMAWNSYNLHDYNRALGLLVTYKAPLLSSYFAPEAEVLSSLAYLELCLWDDALVVIKKFHDDYAPQSEKLETLLNAQKTSVDYFFNLMFDKAGGVNSSKQAPYLNKLLTQIRKKVYFNFKLNYLKKSEYELRRLTSKPKNALVDELVNKVGFYGKDYKRKINKFIKGKMFSFVNEMNRLSEEMYNIHLEALMRKKNVLYESKLGAKEKKRGSIENLKRTSQQYYFKFNGEFWADELGDYSFGLKSECKAI